MKSFLAHIYATVTAFNNAGIESPAAMSTAIALLNPSWIPVGSMSAKDILSWSSVSGGNLSSLVDHQFSLTIYGVYRNVNGHCAHPVLYQ